jgi:hypothetical protein
MILMDWIDLDSVKGNPDRHQNSWELKSSAPKPIDGGMSR